MKRDDADAADELSADFDLPCSLFLLALWPLAPAGGVRGAWGGWGEFERERERFFIFF